MEGREQSTNSAAKGAYKGGGGGGRGNVSWEGGYSLQRAIRGGPAQKGYLSQVALIRRKWCWQKLYFFF